jgi:hypothetical protein
MDARKKNGGFTHELVTTQIETHITGKFETIQSKKIEGNKTLELDRR